ncbi:hypothetical protein BHE74_00031342 [Ensete ventricosum]|nr:hypothetical protein BHE74_00031342 [Ensete ventricosum]
MSYDGSFSCESAFKRLLSRCPALRSDPKLFALYQKVTSSSLSLAVVLDSGAFLIAPTFLIVMFLILPKDGAATADDVVAAMAEPFLHPAYTIPIIGCFRPLCRRIADRAVAKLRAVPCLESVSEEDSDDVGEVDLHVIDFYVTRGRGLRLHELASLALCRSLDLAPFLLRLFISSLAFYLLPKDLVLDINERISLL